MVVVTVIGGDFAVLMVMVVLMVLMMIAPLDDTSSLIVTTWLYGDSTLNGWRFPVGNALTAFCLPPPSRTLRVPAALCAVAAFV